MDGDSGKEGRERRRKGKKEEGRERKRKGGEKGREGEIVHKLLFFIIF